MIKIKPSKTKLGQAVYLEFQITQHSRDIELMKRLVSYFDCGRYVLRNNRDNGDFIVTKFNDVTERIISFCAKYPIKGIKALDFAD